MPDDLIHPSTSVLPHVNQYYARALYGAAACGVGVLALALAPESMVCQFHPSSPLTVVCDIPGFELPHIDLPDMPQPSPTPNLATAVSTSSTITSNSTGGIVR